MQILLRPLRRPGRKNSLLGGGASSPPLLSRGDSAGMMESMEFDENGIPTVFYLDVDNLDQNGGDVGEIIGLGEEEVQLVGGEQYATHHYSVQEDGTIQYHHQQNHNGIDLGQYDLGEGQTTFEFEEVTPMPLADGSHSQLTSSSQSFPSATYTISSSGSVISVPVSSTQSQSQHVSVNGPKLVFRPTTIGGVSVVNSNSNSGIISSAASTAKRKYPVKVTVGAPTSTLPATTATATTSLTTTSSSSPQKGEKRPKLLVNLYEDDVGYEFGCLLKDNTTPSQMSHLIPYSEDYLLQALDREEVPSRAIRHLTQHLKWWRGHLLAEVRDYRRFPLSLRGKTGGPGRNKFRIQQQHQSRDPVVTQLLLRPSSTSILLDFERLIQKSIRSRERWKLKKLNKPTKLSQSLSSLNSSLLDSEEEGGTEEEEKQDSDYEIEFDLSGSLKGEKVGTLTFEQRLELEKELINKTAPPLCLDPSPDVGIIQNRIQYERLKWRSPSVHSRRLISKEDRSNDLSELSPARERLISFIRFVHKQKEKERLNGNGNHVGKEDPLKLVNSSTFVEYPILDFPSNMEDILKLGARPEPCVIRPIAMDNSVKKVEEYTLETERRKRPHTTKLSIYQRNGMDCYFGELEMESIQDGATIKPANSTKCQFELGSSQSVALYVKQFSDIFTEDGRRPCKITYQKVGQPQPQILYTNSYKTQQQQAGSSASATTPSAGPSQPSSTVTTTPIQTQPPVQIVHPQPRTLQPQSQPLEPTSAAVSQVQASNQNVSVVSPTVLTRPQLLTLQQQQQKPGVPPSTAASASHQLRLQQRLMQLKQQQLQQQQQQQQAQQQQQQQPQTQTALAKLLLTNIQQNSGQVGQGRPITVAVQPQPQKATPVTTATITSEASNQSSSGLNVNLGGGTMVLGGVLQGNQTATSASQQIRLHQGGQISQGVNILRVNQSSTAQSQVISSAGSHLGQGGRSSTPTVSVSSSGISRPTSLSALLQSAPQSSSQRILINANNSQQTLTLTSSSGNSSGGCGGDEDSVGVPDLQSLLTTAPAPPSEHNLNLNLNVNLNSAGVITSDPSQSQPAPFLVLISPFRSVPVSINQRGPTTLLQQQLSQGQQQQNISLNLQGDHQVITGDLMDHSGNHHQGNPSGDLFDTIKIEPGEGGGNTVMIGNTTYSVNVSESGGGGSDPNKKDPGLITLSDLLGSSPPNPTPVQTGVGVASSSLNSLILQGQGSVSSQSQSQILVSPQTSSVNSTPRLSALLAGTPSADSSGVGVGALIGGRVDGGTSPDSSRTLLDRLSASLSSASATTPSTISSTQRSGLNPIATATPSVVLDHPVLAATLTGQQPSPKLVPAYRQIAPAPSASPRGGKLQ